MNYERLNWNIISEMENIEVEEIGIKKTSHVFHFFRSRNGYITCECRNKKNGKFLLHSRYEPIKEARRTIDSQLAGYDSFQKVIVYGFGCGHHIRELLKRVDPDVEVEILETNVPFFYELLKKDDFQDIFKDKRIKLKVTQQVNKVLSSFQLSDNCRSAVVIHEPSLRLIPENLNEFREALEKFRIHIATMNNFSTLLKENFMLNISLNDASIGSFINKFEDTPIVMVSAGPSLEKNIHLLHEVKKHSLICCVGTALKPLLNCGVQPDFFMMIDPSERVFEQLEGLCHLDIPLFYLSTVNYNVLFRYKGPKFIVYQEGYPLAEQTALKQNVPVIRSGGSVATALFDLLLKFNFSPVCLVGQDLAYTNYQTHVRGAHNFKEFKNVAKELIYVTNFDLSDKVPTSKQLLVYRDWFTKRALSEKRPLYNATEGGAFIEGFEHIHLNDFIEKVRHIDIMPVRKYFNHLILVSLNKPKR